MTVTLGGAGLSVGQVVGVARHGEKLALAAAARTRMERSRTLVGRAAASREPVYGVSTGFGALAGTRVAPLRQPELQLALIRSHASGMGADQGQLQLGLAQRSDARAGQGAEPGGDAVDGLARSRRLLDAGAAALHPGARRRRQRDLFAMTGNIHDLAFRQPG